MSRRVCHACAGLPRSVFCNVCDTEPEPLEQHVEKYQVLERHGYPLWCDTNKAGYEHAMRCGVQVRRLIWSY